MDSATHLGKARCAQPGSLAPPTPAPAPAPGIQGSAQSGQGRQEDPGGAPGATHGAATWPSDPACICVPRALKVSEDARAPPPAAAEAPRPWRMGTWVRVGRGVLPRLKKGGVLARATWLDLQVPGIDQAQKDTRFPQCEGPQGRQGKRTRRPGARGRGAGVSLEGTRSVREMRACGWGPRRHRAVHSTAVKMARFCEVYFTTTFRKRRAGLSWSERRRPGRGAQSPPPARF